MEEHPLKKIFDEIGRQMREEALVVSFAQIILILAGDKMKAQELTVANKENDEKMIEALAEATVEIIGEGRPYHELATDCLERATNEFLSRREEAMEKMKS
jgi:microcystin degradation protein MlrC